MDKDQVKKMAALSRLEIDDGEAESLAQELVAILDYVKDVKNISANSGSEVKPILPLRNVFRDDALPHETGIHTERLLKAAPAREGNYLKVKKIM